MPACLEPHANVYQCVHAMIDKSFGDVTEPRADKHSIDCLGKCDGKEKGETADKERREDR